MGTFTMTLRTKLDMVIQLCKLLPSSREVSLAITDAQRAYNWLGRYQLLLGENNVSVRYEGLRLDNTTPEFLFQEVLDQESSLLDLIKVYLEEGGQSEPALFLAMNCINESQMWVDTAMLLPWKIQPKPSVEKEQAPTTPVSEPSEEGASGNTMPFYTALLKCITQKKRISRTQWGSSVYVTALLSDKNIASYLVRALPGNRFVPWQPDQMDLFANDWITLN